MLPQNIIEGMELPEKEKGPITREQLVDYASISGDYNKIHYDEAFAKKAGLDGCIAHGMLVMGLMGSYITDWAIGGTLITFQIRFSGMTKENDTLTFKGQVEKIIQEEGATVVEISVISKTQDNRITTQGSAVIRFN